MLATGSLTPVATVAAIASEDLGFHDDGKTHLLRVDGEIGTDGRWHVRRAGGQGSHQLTAMARANSLALVPDGVAVAEGDEVEIIIEFEAKQED